NTLMAVEVALAIVVLVSAGLFLRGFLATRNEDPGFRREGVLLAGFDLSGRGMDDAAVRTFSARLLARLNGAPGIERAAIAASVPLDIHAMPSRAFTMAGLSRPYGA